MELCCLPITVLTQIFQYLRLQDLANLMLTCKTIKNLILEDSLLWLSKSKICIYNSINSQSNHYNKYLSPYHRCRISQNWIRGIFRERVIIRHGINYIPWLILHEHYVIITVGSELRCYPRNQKCFAKYAAWKIDCPKIIRSGIRTNDISKFIFKDNIIICGNRDGCMVLYECSKGRNEPKLLHHVTDCHKSGGVEVSAVEASVKGDQVNYAISVSDYDNYIKIWQINDKVTDCLINETTRITRNISKRSSLFNSKELWCEYQCSREIPLVVNTGGRCLALNQDDSKLCIGLNGNIKPILIDVETGEALLKGAAPGSQRQVVRDVQWVDGNTVGYVTHLGQLRCLDTRTGIVVYNAMDPFHASLYCVRSDGRNALLVGSSQHCRCVLFDRRAHSSHVQIYFTQSHSSPVYSLDFDATTLVAAADRAVATLDYNVPVSQARVRDYSDPCHCHCHCHIRALFRTRALMIGPLYVINWR